MNIKVFYDNIKFRLRDSGRKKKLMEKVIRSEGKHPDDLLFIFTGDRKIRIINREFLKHDRFTDVIAFGYGKKKEIAGEIYISVDSVKINALNYKVSFNDEILRVMIHGTLHLCGYEDDNLKKKLLMTSLENKWIDVYKNMT